MAGQDSSSQSGRMRDLTIQGDAASDDGDSVCQDNVGGHLDLDPDHVEDRFRVDRRKLEQMLQGPEDEGRTAEDFFLKIMQETGTQITWPSKLKIGAKSKKDPHVKVCGKKEAVVMAKDRIMAVLDTKSNRVTLKMDVSHTDHSHVIGKGGNNIKRVMQDTGCHIHFPDSNRNNQTEKSNQVSIAGQPSGVEQARAKIRELLPLVFMFELPVAGVLQPVPDASTPAIQQIQQTYDVVVTFKQRPRVYSTTVVIRGTVNNAKAVKEATAILIEHLVGNLGATVLVSTQLEIAAQHHLFMIGRGGANIKQIMQQTGASIHFPDPNTATPQRKGTVFITGGIESVFLARQQLIGCLPLVLMFDMKEEADIEQGSVSSLMEQLDVFISVKPKPKQPSKSVIVKSIERNAANMYEARLRLLGLSSKCSPTVTSPPSSSADILTSQRALAGNLSLAGLGLITHTMLGVNTNGLQLMLNGTRSPLPSPGAPTPAGVVSPPPGLVNPMMLLTPPSNYTSMQVAPPVNTHDGTSNKEASFTNPSHNTAIVRVPTPSDKGASSTNSSSSPCGSPSTNNPPPELISSPIHKDARRHAEVELRRIPSADRFMDIRVPRGNVHSPSSSGSRDMLSCMRDPNATIDLASSLGSLTGSPECNKKHGVRMDDCVRNISFQNGDRSSESGCESDGSDSRAPGSHRPPPGTSSLFTGNSLFAWNIDYEQKKLLATKAMQKKPLGESRIPTDFWSGLGFSKSMPDSAIRERLHQINLNKYNGPSMSTTYEQQEPRPPTPNSPDVDRDPWKSTDPNRPTNPPVNPAPGEYPSPRKKVMEMGLTSSNHIDSVRMLPPGGWPRPNPPPGFENGKPDLAELFSKLGLGKYTDLFQQQEIDLQTFLTLTDQDLKELGICTFGARKKMLLAIADLNKSHTLLSAPTTTNNNPFRDNGAYIYGARRQDIASQSGRW